MDFVCGTFLYRKFQQKHNVNKIFETLISFNLEFNPLLVHMQKYLLEKINYLNKFQLLRVDPSL